MSTQTGLARRPATAAASIQAGTLGTLLALIRLTDLDSLHASFDVPTIYAELPWTVDSAAIIDEADGVPEGPGLEYVLEVALAQDLLAGLVGADGHPTETECVEAVTAYSVTGHFGSTGHNPWVSRCLAC